jgi:hypothetical protein
MDAPAGLQRPSEGNPSTQASRRLIGPRVEHSRLSAGVAAAGAASDSSPGSTRGFGDDPNPGPRPAPARHGCTADDGHRLHDWRVSWSRVRGCSTVALSHADDKRAGSLLSRIDPSTSLTQAGIRLPCLSSNPRVWGLLSAQNLPPHQTHSEHIARAANVQRTPRSLYTHVQRIETVPLQPLVPTKRPWPWLAARRPLPAPLMQS